MRKLLFVAENICLAQVVRLVALAERLDSAEYEVHFACSHFDPVVFASTRFKQWLLPTIDGPRAMQRLARGDRLYDTKTLSGYVEDELKLLQQLKPDLVIGDFRLSLPVSAQVSGVPCATLINAYWSPFALRERFPVPDHPIVRVVGLKVAERYLPEALPKAFSYFAAPMNSLRKRFGLAPLDSLLDVLTAGDFTLFADIPELVPTVPLPAHQRFLGGVNWSPNIPEPEWFQQLRTDRPVVYVTLGSSGALEALPVVLEAIGKLPIQAVLSTAARIELKDVPKNVSVAPYLPGHLAARRADFVITNGGSSTGYQALMEGVPVLGVPSNLDQYLAMTAIERAGAGILVRAGGVQVAQILEAAQRLLTQSTFRARARAVQADFARYDCHQNFREFLRAALPDSGLQEDSAVAE